MRDRAHRPWEVPDDAPWLMGQTWDRLLFAHWRVRLELLRQVVHPSIPIDTWDGSAWLAVTPFDVRGLHARGLPPVPFVSSFAEVNVRTYATIDGKPGIYFFSLDATSWAAVFAARRAYRLPYYRARGTVEYGSRGRLRFVTSRVHGPAAELDVEYEPTGPRFTAAPGSFEYWACERYCLYTADESGQVLRGDIHHPPWPLHPARATFAENSMGRQIGLALDDEPVLHYAPSQHVVFWALRPAAERRAGP